MQAEAGAVAQLLGRELPVVVRETAEAVVPPGLGLVELGDVLVIRVVDRGQRLVIGDSAGAEEPARDADDPVDHLGLDPVALLVLPALDRVRGPRLLARREARLGEDASALAAGHARAVHAVGSEGRLA